jgi:hypothetical protein
LFNVFKRPPCDGTTLSIFCLTSLESALKIFEPCFSDILKAENGPSKIPAVYEFMGIFDFQNPGAFPDQRSELMGAACRSPRMVRIS